MLNALVVFLGGGVGALARYGLASAISRTALGAMQYPIATFLINVSGSFLLGFLYAAISSSARFSPAVSLALTVGFCGAFTTFSTFSVEILSLLKNGAIFTAALYLFASLILGVLAAFAGMSCARAVFS